MKQKQSERQFQTQVVSLAKQFGWMVYHTYDSRRSEPGFPDLVLVRDRILYRELKSETGRITPTQKQWGERLTLAGADYAIWRPSDMPHIIKQLTTREKPHG